MDVAASCLKYAIHGMIDGGIVASSQRYEAPHPELAQNISAGPDGAFPELGAHRPCDRPTGHRRP